jgi:hypothetical protein
VQDRSARAHIKPSNNSYFSSSPGSCNQWPLSKQCGSEDGVCSRSPKQISHLDYLRCLTSRIPARRRTFRVQSPYRARGDFKGRSPLASLQLHPDLRSRVLNFVCQNYPMQDWRQDALPESFPCSQNMADRLSFCLNPLSLSLKKEKLNRACGSVGKSRRFWVRLFHISIGHFFRQGLYPQILPKTLSPSRGG